MTQAELFRPDGGPAFACTGKLVATCDKPYLRADDQVSAHLQTVALYIARRTGRVTADDLHDYPDLIGQRDGRVIVMLSAWPESIAGLTTWAAGAQEVTLAPVSAQMLGE